MANRRLISDRLSYRFESPGLLEQALVHRSADAQHNERLEFLGDAALNLVIAAELYTLEPGLREGDLSRLRASLVRAETLTEVAREVNLGDFLTLGPGVLKGGGGDCDSILADALEAVFGAVYVDGGFEACRRTILELFRKRLQQRPAAELLKDPKTRLQETLQARRIALPVYEVVAESGAPHQRTFRVTCLIESLQLRTEASASSRRKAEQAAAHAALQTLPW